EVGRFDVSHAVSDHDRPESCGPGSYDEDAAGADQRCDPECTAPPKHARSIPGQRPYHAVVGGVPERSNGAVLKTVGRASVPWVRIPPPPLGTSLQTGDEDPRRGRAVRVERRR